MRPKVLAVSSYFPWPLDRGDPVRVEMYLRALNQVADLTVLATDREGTADGERESLAKRIPDSSIRAFTPSGTSGIRRFPATRWILSVLQATPSWIGNRRSIEIARFIKKHEAEFDYCFLIGEAAGQYAPRNRSSTFHWDKSNVLTASTKGDMAEVPLWSLARARLWLISVVSQHFERRVLSRVDRVSVTSVAEAERLLTLQHRDADYVHPSTVEPIPPATGVNAGSKSILWMGSFQYHSNLNGLLRFVKEGLPVLTSNGFTLRVVGSGASPEQASLLQSIPGIDYRGFVPNLADALKDVKVAVIPLWSGAGVKIKTLTLLGLGVPVVGTETAFEGIRSEAAVALTESAYEMATVCVQADALQLRIAQTEGFKELAGDFSEREFFRRVESQLTTPDE